MFWKKQWKKILGKDGEEHYQIPSYSKDGGHIKSLERQGGLTTSASYGGMGIRELQLRMELLVEPVLSTHNSVFDAAKQLAVFAKVDQDRFLNSVDRICNTNIELGFNFCQYAPRSLQLVEEENWLHWIEKILEAYSENGIESATDVIHRVDDYIHSLEHAPSSVSLNEISRILESFVMGLSGRYLGIEVNDEFYTDTESIRLPEVSEQFNKREDNFTLYKAMAVHQWAQTWYGTWRMNVETLVKSFKDPDRALSIFHKLETIRLDACIANELPGIARAMKELDEKQIRNNKHEDNYSKSWLRAIEKLKEPGMTVQDTMFFLEAVYKDEHSPAKKIYQGSLKPDEARAAINARAMKEKKALKDKLTQLQQDLNNISRENTKNESGEASGDSIAEDGDKGFSIKEIEDDSLPDGFRIELQYDEKEVEPPEDIQQLLASILQDFGNVPDDYLKTETSQPEDEKELEKSTENNSTDENEDVFLYDEWDHSRQKYRKNWCHLRELDIKPIENNFVNKTLHKHRGLIKHLHRTFEALRQDDKRMKRQPFGDDIDLDAVIDAYTDTKMGFEASQNLFTKSRKIDRNIAVMFMIDMSGSTAGWINEMEREALVLLCESLEILGDRYAIYGFSGATHERCELYKIKEFNEDYNNEVKARISGIEPQDYTRMGASIRHLTKLLHQVEARTKILITLSDGRPDDQDGYRGPYGIEDTRRALIEAKFLGIHPFCITIDDEAMDYLQHMYGAVNFAVIDHVDKLPYKVSDIYRRITI
ncbi:MAG: nitric oxide reductase activation protein NorD [Gammaproteobacteria bacterium]